MKYIHFIELLGISIFLVCLIAEVIFRVYRKIKSGSKKPQLLTAYLKEYYESMSVPDCWRYIPLALRVFYPLKSSRKVINSNIHGFRTHNFPKEKTKHKVVVILGGSASWGLGASSDKNVSANILENILGEKEWRVYNLSMMAATTQGEVLNLIFWGLKLRPAYVVSITGYNDLHLPNVYFDSENEIFIDPQLQKANDFYKVHSVKSGGVIHESAQFLRGTSRLFNALVNKWEQRNQEDRSSVLSTMNLRLKRTVSNLILLNDLSHTVGAKYTAILQPVGYGKKILSDSEKENQDYFLKRHPHHQVFEDMKAYQSEHKSIYGIKMPIGFNILNLEHHFDNEPLARFTDGITHLNDEGHSELAEAIYYYLVSSKQIGGF